MPQTALVTCVGYRESSRKILPRTVLVQSARDGDTEHGVPDQPLKTRIIPGREVRTQSRQFAILLSGDNPGSELVFIALEIQNDMGQWDRLAGHGWDDVDAWPHAHGMDRGTANYTHFQYGGYPAGGSYISSYPGVQSFRLTVNGVPIAYDVLTPATLGWTIQGTFDIANLQAVETPPSLVPPDTGDLGLDVPDSPNTCLLYTSPSPRDS